MNPGRFFIPRMGTNFGPMMSSGYLPTRGGIGLFGKISSTLRSFNWGGLLNGANKTLNVVNQTIPLVRQAGPMFSNMKSMLRLAKVFGNETISRNQKRNNDISKSNNILPNNQNNNNSNNISNIVTENNIIEKEVINDSYPNFFV